MKQSDCGSCIGMTNDHWLRVTVVVTHSKKLQSTRAVILRPELGLAHIATRRY